MPVERFTISLDEDLAAEMDRVRGLVTRSRWIAEAVGQVLSAPVRRTCTIWECPSCGATTTDWKHGIDCLCEDSGDWTEITAVLEEPSK